MCTFQMYMLVLKTVEVDYYNFSLQNKVLGDLMHYLMLMERDSLR